MDKIKYLIVGQGLAGTLLSYYFYKNNIAHKVIAAKTLPAASAVAAGIFNPLVFRRLTKSWMIDDLLPEMMQTYAELEKLLDTKLIYNTPIAKLINPDERKWWAERIESQGLYDYFEGFRNNHDALGIKSTYDLALIKNSGYVDLKTLLKEYRNHLKEINSLILEDFSYTDLNFENTEIEWKGIKAEKIIFCEGSFAINNPFFPEGVFYLAKGDVLSVTIPDLPEDFILNKDVFILPRGGHNFLIGSTYGRDNLNWEVELENQKILMEKVKLFMNLPITVTDHKVGIRPTVKDRRPILGLHHQHKTMAFFNGLGTKGVMLAPYFGNEMFCFLENSKFVLSHEVNIDRFYS